MLVIVGHGPSIVGKRLGSWLDNQVVVRLKNAPRPNAEDWGTRIDYRCAGADGWPEECPVWVIPARRKVQHLFQSHGTVSVSDGRWHGYFEGFNPKYEPSTGLRAIFCALEFLAPKEIGLIGFDNILRPHVKGLTKWFHEPGKFNQVHDYDTEHKAAFGLHVELIDLGEMNG